MKKNDWSLLLSALAYGYLFYEQNPGANFLVFNLVLIGALIVRNQELLRDRKWLFVASGALFSSVCILLYGNFLSVFANICSLSILSVLSANTSNSIIISLFYSVYSYCSALPYMVVDAMGRISKNLNEDKNAKGKRWLLYIIPVFVTLIFVMLYRGASTMFKNLTDHINLDFISFGWIFFTLSGTILLYGFFNSKKIEEIESAVQGQSDTVSIKHNMFSRVFGYEISVLSEFDSGKIMLIMLNVLLLVVNFLDIEFLFFGHKLPEGVSYADFVHQGIGSLIFSIITAIAIIIWYFRGELNFYKGNKVLKNLALLWIAQNMLMIISNLYRNGLYIEEYNLTYKRIGVYIYLILAIVGLMITAIKITKIKSNWYLFKVNGLAFYICLVLSCAINWDMLITRYNISHAVATGKHLDEWYIESLSDKVLPDLYIWSIYNRSSCTDSFIRSLNVRMDLFNWEQTLVDWRSWNIEAARTERDLHDLHH